MTEPWNPAYIELIAQLRRCRKQLSVTQKQLAQRLGKEQSFISKIETCERRLDLIETFQICEALDISIEDVLPVQFHHLLRRKE